MTNTKSKLNIKFSHTYIKMPESVKQSRLIQIFKIHKDALSSPFIDWDTLYFQEGEGLVKYTLPEGIVLVLLLLDSDSRMLWTTIRRYTPEKESYYSSNIGQTFDIVIEDDK